ncbi:MAG: aminodeoxychorismate/anthranilate synthase component II [bacterium]|nr:aminodeoxychorismate/anthranilate synthase component II [bacterium]
MILFIDNYDSFSYNLVQYFKMLNQDILVIQNDQFSLSELYNIQFQKVVLSPGPGSPKNAGICNEVILRFGEMMPILGICLGHQCIGEVFGATIKQAIQPFHGKSSRIYHSGKGIFQGIPSPFVATRYHSLVISNENLPSNLEVLATSEQNEIMAIQHKQLPIYGVQFHPEAILTEYGFEILKNWLSITKK